ncbi:hypothetical protein N9301_06765, partial [Paracoccaceae bacterium]|nr:hypothetical protein [Paracoccaceae bacterium]
SAIIIAITMNNLAYAQNKKNCRVLELTDKKVQEEYLGLLEELNGEIEAVIINYKGGNYFKTMRIAYLLKKSDIAVIIDEEAVCENDCSAIFFAARRRYNNIPLNFPSYSHKELEIIKSLKPYEFYPHIKMKDVYQFLRTNYKYYQLKLLTEAFKNPSLKIQNQFNSLTHDEKNSIINNCSYIRKIKQTSKSLKKKN